jgi:hypothetical protein
VKQSQEEGEKRFEEFYNGMLKKDQEMLDNKFLLVCNKEEELQKSQF